MTNMIPENVDVTEYIESGKFLIDSCEGRIEKLTKVNPIVLNKNYEIELRNKLQIWKKNYSKSSKNEKLDSIYKSTFYLYSYFIIDEPIDVYKTKINIKGNKDIELFIRLNQKGKIDSDFSENNWVENNCEQKKQPLTAVSSNGQAWDLLIKLL